MNTFDYETFVYSKLKKLPYREHLAHIAMGLSGEAGEVTDMVKKEFAYHKRWKEEDMTLELGDVLFYLTALAIANGDTLERIIDRNVEKLNKRYTGAYSDVEAITRKDTK